MTFEDFVGFTKEPHNTPVNAPSTPVPGFTVEEYLRTFEAFAPDESTHVLVLPLYTSTSSELAPHLDNLEFSDYSDE